MADGQQGLIIVRDSEPSKGRVVLMRIVAIGASVIGVGLATTLAYFIFQGIRRTRLDNILDEVYRAVRGVWRLFVDMDPVVAAWAFPLIGGFIIVMGMLIHRHYDK